MFFSNGNAGALYLSAVAFLACGSPPPPVEPVSEPVAEAQPAATPSEGSDAEIPEKTADRGQIHVSDRIKEACGISDADTHFAFNSSNVNGQSKAVLQKLATCFSTGPLAGEVMKLVGFTDPRGDEQYNLALGGRRADNVKGVVVSLGLSADKVTTTSRGAMDARGTDEESWAFDRKVEVKVDG